MSFRPIDEHVVYRGSLVTVARGTFEGPGGVRFERDIVRHPGAVAIVPLIDDRTALLVRQYRAAIDQEVLEIPAGKRDVPGEPPEVTAARELVEEVGREAARLELIARFYNSAGFNDELTWVYLAHDLTLVADSRQGVEEQAMTLHEVRLDDVDAMIAAGDLIDAKTIVGLSVALRRLG